MGYGLSGEVRAVHVMEESRDELKLSPSVVAAMRDDMMQVRPISVHERVAADCSGAAFAADSSLAPITMGGAISRGYCSPHHCIRSSMKLSPNIVAALRDDMMQV